MGQVLAGEATPAQIAALATALRAKGESVEEMTGFVRAMVTHAVPLHLPAGMEVIDTCGTGGDRLRSINVSTIAALVVAATGAKVCKHGGRASSSAVGAADVLEALGVVADLGPAGVVRCIEEVGMGFCFAPRFHPAMRFAAPVRKELGIPTVFNYLGPVGQPGTGPVPGGRGEQSRPWPTRCWGSWPPTVPSGPWWSTATTDSTS